MLALTAALAFGGADFIGAVASRKIGPIPVVLWMELAGLVVAPVFLIAGKSSLSLPTMGLAATSGVLGGIGLCLFYRAMSTQAIGVAASLVGVVAAGWPVAWGLLGGEHPHPLQGAGLVLGLLAIAVIGSNSIGATSLAGVCLAIAAGCILGTGFILLNAASSGGAWTLVTTRLISFGILAPVALFTRSVRVPVGTVPLVVAVGVLDATGMAAFLLASRVGLLVVIVVLASMYPAVTTLLARIVTREHMRPSQTSGVLLALGALALISTG